MFLVRRAGKQKGLGEIFPKGNEVKGKRLTNPPLALLKIIYGIHLGREGGGGKYVQATTKVIGYRGGAHKSMPGRGGVLQRTAFL